MAIENVDTSPNTDFYYVGKGVLKFKEKGAPAYRDLGNCPLFELTSNVAKLEHYSSRVGTRTKDLVVVQTKQLTVRFTLDELSGDNVALALMGTEDSNGTNIMDRNIITGALRFIGTNAVGEKKQVDLPTVLVTPNGNIGFISDGFAIMELTGDVTADQSGSFGRILHDISVEVP